jgi:type I restriction enzyme S subunit
MSTLCAIKSGKSDTQDAVEDGEFAFFDRSKKIKKSSRYLYDCEALIIAGEGAEFLPKHFNGKFDLHQRAYALHNFNQKINVKYLYYYLHYLKDYLPSVAVGATVKSLRLRHFENLPVVLFPITTQQKIVAKLDAIFAEIDTATAAAEANAKNAEALFQSYLTEVLGNVEWRTIKIENIYKVASSKRVLKSDWQANGVPFYRGREITLLSKYGNVDNELYITEEMYDSYAKKYGVPKENDIMITAIGTIGNSYIVKKADKFYFKDASVLWLKNIGNTKSEFINYWFKSSHFYNQLSVGLGATVDTLTIGKVQSLVVNLPSVEEQIVTVRLLDNFYENIKVIQSSNKNKILELKALKQSILQQAFSGELVKD